MVMRSRAAEPPATARRDGPEWFAVHPGAGARPSQPARVQERGGLVASERAPIAETRRSQRRAARTSPASGRKTSLR